MYYAPHLLQIKSAVQLDKDEYGRPIPYSGEEQWITICECRADQNPAQEFTDENGNTFRTDFHVVLGKRNVSLRGGEIVRVVWKSTGEIKCEGKVIRPRTLNYLEYGDFWVQV